MKKAIEVGSRELKTRLGTYLRQVREGRRIVVTERGRPVAELRRLEEGEVSLDARLRRLEVAGLVTRPTRRSLDRLRPLRSRGRSMSEAISEDREDRF